MALSNIKRCESVPGKGIAKLKHHKQKTGYSIHLIIITDSVVLWKIQKFDWLIPETK